MTPLLYYKMHLQMCVFIICKCISWQWSGDWWGHIHWSAILQSQGRSFHLLWWIARYKELRTAVRFTFT